jgi:hypothetical protein
MSTFFGFGFYLYVAPVTGAIRISLVLMQEERQAAGPAGRPRQSSARGTGNCKQSSCCCAAAEHRAAPRQTISKRSNVAGVTEGEGLEKVATPRLRDLGGGEKIRFGSEMCNMAHNLVEKMARGRLGGSARPSRPWHRRRRCNVATKPLAHDGASKFGSGWGAATEPAALW